VKNKTKILVLFLLSAIAGFLLGDLMLKSFIKLTISDFHVYYYVSKMVFSYDTHPYSNFKPVYPYYFPPASLLLFWGLTLVPFYLSKIIFTVINAFLFILSVFLINKMIVGKISFSFWIMLILGLLFYPLRFTFSDGQFNVVMLAFFTIGLYAFKNSKPVIGGISLGLGIITKISPAIIVAYAFWRKKFNLVMVAGITVILLSLASEYLVRKDINYYYAKNIVRDVSNQSSGLGHTDQSLLGFIKRVVYEEKIEISKDTKSIISYSIVAVLGLAFLVIDLKAKKGPYNLYIDYFILTTIGVVGTGLAWYHQYTILLLPLFGTMLLCLNFFDKKYLKIKIAYIVVLILVYLSWFLDLKSDYFSPEGYKQFMMLYGAVILLAGLYILKIKQKWLVERATLEGFQFNNKYLYTTFLLFLTLSLKPWSLGEALKEGRDEARIKAIDSMSKALVSSKVGFKVGESNSYISSNRIGGKGYILSEKGKDDKVLEKMSVLYIDSVNNEKYNYKFSSQGGKNFNLGARLESRKFIEMYGDVYSTRDTID